MSDEPRIRVVGRSDRPDNDVFLRGRLAGAAVTRELPSGDVLAVFRATVDRPEGDRGRVDSVDCVASRPRVRERLARLPAGQWVELEGCLRRRFWRGPTGPASRYAVDATVVRAVRGPS